IGSFIVLCFFMFFFFQAEDGIRDDLVTGVQTCALPIYWAGSQDAGPRRQPLENRPSCPRGLWEVWKAAACDLLEFELSQERKTRSEERRVGKECRSGWSRYG